MRKGFIKLIFIVMLLFTLIGCERGNIENKNVESLHITYKKGLPTEDSPGFMEFMKSIFENSSDITLANLDGVYIVARSDKDGFRYFQYTKDQLKDVYQPLFSASDISQELYHLREKNNFEQIGIKIENEADYHLPNIYLKRGNIIEIETKFGMEKVDLAVELNERDLIGAKEVYFKVKAVSEKTVVIQIDNLVGGETNRETYYLFIQQDLSGYHLLRSTELYSTLESEELNNYLDIFPLVDLSGRYAYVLKQTIFDKKENKVIKLKENDVLSKDGKYVYINGNSEELSNGVQRIQSVENYVKQNEIYETEFNLDFNEIAEILKLKTSGISIAKVNYFNEDFIVLRLFYKGKVVGSAGATNAIIDLQNSKDNPTIYLIDLGIE
ncbi:hypothetical protein [Metabacillus fastidiosus]|uniref:hypothetical protein n=1 Tax=Metabacillus fastidiosus TaxID=1458 RepID=UPI003D2A9B0D